MNDPTTDARLFYPATQRNQTYILEVLRDALPPSGKVLEISSGSGEHGVYFSQALPELRWVPSDPDPRCLASIEAWRHHQVCPNLASPLRLDVCERPWPIDHADAVVNINMIHIAPWEACIALLDGCAALLDEGSPLVMYGPYQIGGEHTSESNWRFDQSLRSRDPRWGVRDLDDVIACARDRGLVHQQTVAMPANNLSVIYRRSATS